MLRVLFAVLILALPNIMSGQDQPKQNVPSRIEHQWRKIAKLPPGTAIVIRESSPSATVHCRLTWIDSNSVACDLLNAGTRIVVPIYSVRSIAAEPPKRHVNIPLAVGAGFFGCALGAVVFDFDGGNGKGGGFGCLGGAALFVGDVYAASH